MANKGGRYVDGAEDAWKRILKLRQFGYTDVPSPSGGGGKIQPLDLKPSPVSL